MVVSDQMNVVKELVITRMIDAPPRAVWKAWTDPEYLKRWWGPKGFTAPVCRADARVGGTYHFCMRSPEGEDFWSTGVYEEVIPFERIVCTDSFADENGNVVPASHYGMEADFPHELLLTVTFESRGSMTELTLRQGRAPAGEMYDAMMAGWQQSIDKLAECLNEQI